MQVCPSHTRARECPKETLMHTFPCTQAHTRTYIHMHSGTLSCTHSHALRHTLMHTFPCTQAHSHAHNPMHPGTHSCTHSHALRYTLMHAFPCTQVHTHAHIHMHPGTHSDTHAVKRRTLKDCEHILSSLQHDSVLTSWNHSPRFVRNQRTLKQRTSNTSSSVQSKETQKQQASKHRLRYGTKGH